MALDRQHINRLKLTAEIRDIIEAYGAHGLRESAGSFKGHCPFPDHDDRTPSFSIGVEGDYKGSWICSCGKGDIISFICRMEDVSFAQAVTILRRYVEEDRFDQLNTKLLETQLDKVLRSTSLIRPVPPPMPFVQMDIEHRIEVAKYLWWRRRYTAEEAGRAIARFGLGWCTDDRRYLNGRGEYTTCYKNTIVFPITNARGDYRLFQSQDVSYPPRPQNKFFPAGPGTIYDALMGVRQAMSMGTTYVIVCEGMWDVVRLQMAGFPAVGTLSKNIQKEQVAQLLSMYDTIYLAYDADVSGQVACQNFAFMTNGLVALKKMDFDAGKDPDDCTPEELLHSFESAERFTA